MCQLLNPHNNNAIRIIVTWDIRAGMLCAPTPSFYRRGIEGPGQLPDRLRSHNGRGRTQTLICCPAVGSFSHYSNLAIGPKENFPSISLPRGWPTTSFRFSCRTATPLVSLSLCCLWSLLLLGVPDLFLVLPGGCLSSIISLKVGSGVLSLAPELLLLWNLLP